MPHSPPTLPEALLDAAATVNDALRQQVETLDVPPQLRDAVAYSLLGAGKRLRPALILLTSDLCGGSRDAAMPAACAMELVHCFSLVHDDLPAMDDDDLRRGRPTLHRHTSEAMAILAGDLMLTWAAELLAACPAQQAMLTAATRSMIAGQVLDTLGERQSAADAESELRRIHELKTGALIRASCQLGGLAAGAAPVDIDRLGRFGDCVGLMFQIVDDLLDVTQTAEHVGKATGKDSAAGKLTWPGLFGVEACRNEVADLRTRAHGELEGFGDASRPLIELTDFLAVRTR